MPGINSTRCEVSTTRKRSTKKTNEITKVIDHYFHNFEEKNFYDKTILRSENFFHVSRLLLIKDVNFITTKKN